MKTRLFLFLLSVISISTFAQDVEIDDMYFNSKHRAKLNAAREKEAGVYASARSEVKADEEVESVNPTDSYSARNVNPEYEARSNAEVAMTDNENYFSPNYQYQTESDLNSWNNNFNSQYNNSWYQNSYWTPGMYSWNSPYYGNYYDPWANIWYNPYTRPGWRSTISFSYGNCWGCGGGWGMGYGYGGGYGYGYDPFYGGWGNPYSYWYNPYSYWGGGYPGGVVVVERNRSNAYGKRNSRNTSNISNGNTSVGGRPIVTNPNGRSESGSRLSSNRSTRTSTTSRTEQTEYYNRSWRNESQSSSNEVSSPSRNTSRSYSNDNSSPSRNTTRSSSSSDWNNSSWSNSGSRSNNSGGSNSSYSPSRSSGSSGSSSGGGGGSRSSSGGGGGGGGSSRSRGR